jgi:hypothetical protein
MRKHAVPIQDFKLLTFGQVAEVLESVIEDYGISCPPENAPDSCIAVSDVVHVVTATLEKKLRETLMRAAMQLLPTAPVAQPVTVTPAKQRRKQPTSTPTSGAVPPWMQQAATPAAPGTIPPWAAPEASSPAKKLRKRTAEKV